MITPSIRIRIDYRSVIKIMGQLLCVECLLLFIPLIVELAYADRGWAGFLIAIGASGVAGAGMWWPFRFRTARIQRHEGYLLTSAAWFVFAAFGMIPFIFQPYPLSITDAFFETVSGFTTTGATVIADVERLGHGLLLWRAMTQWLGGLGIILFMLAILPWLNDRGSIPLFNAETTGITHTKLHPRIRQTSSALWKIYTVLTILLTLLLWIGPMDLFDAICQSLSCMATGGFSTRNAGISAWNSQYADLILTLFMFIGGVNFVLIYGAVHGDWKSMFRNDTLKWYLMIVLAAYVAILSARLSDGAQHDVMSLFTEPMFEVVSAITTTGFSLCDFGTWSGFAVMVIILLMVSGACAGSTTGAMKIDRIVALSRNLRNEIRASINPKRVYEVTLDGNVLGSYELKRVTAFFTIYVMLIVAGSLFTCCFGLSILDSIFATVSCIGNNGMGYGITAAEGGFGNLPDPVLWLNCLLMVIGRLELFSVLVLFSPSFWRK